MEEERPGTEEERAGAKEKDQEGQAKDGEKEKEEREDSTRSICGGVVKQAMTGDGGASPTAD